MSVSRSRRETRDFWQRQVSLWFDSGLSKAAFCREHDLHPASFSQWSRRLTSMASKSKKSLDAATDSEPPLATTSISMIPVTVVDEKAQSVATLTAGSGPNVVAQNGHVSLTLPASIDAEQASVWLQALASLDVQY